MDNDYEEFFDPADDMPLAQRIVYIGMSVVFALTGLAALALIIKGP